MQNIHPCIITTPVAIVATELDDRLSLAAGCFPDSTNQPENRPVLRDRSDCHDPGLRQPTWTGCGNGTALGPAYSQFGASDQFVDRCSFRENGRRSSGVVIEMCVQRDTEESIESGQQVTRHKGTAGGQ